MTIQLCDTVYGKVFFIKLTVANTLLAQVDNICIEGSHT